MDLDRDRINSLAEVLIAARNDGAALEPLPSNLVPSSAEEAQATDDAVAAISGWTVLGWKIGCTSEHAQQMLGASGPFAGRVYSMFDDGVMLGPDELMRDPLLEGEFAFTLGADVAPVAGGQDRASVVAAVANVRPAIEIVGGRFAEFVGTPLLCLIADAGANSHLVVGPPIESWDAEGLAKASASMTVDGTETGSGTGADVLGGPVTALMWLVEHLAGRGIGLEAGQVITTGTATQVSPLVSGSTATATIDGVGSVSLSRR